MKKRVALLLCFSFFLVGCQLEPIHTTSSGADSDFYEPKDVIDQSSSEVSIEVFSSEASDVSEVFVNDFTIKPILREEAGLSIIPIILTNDIKLPNEIKEALDTIKTVQDNKPFSDTYYQKGLEMPVGGDSCLIINEKWKDEIVNGIKIGNSVATLESVLGKALLKEESEDEFYLGYKTEEYYFCFQIDNSTQTIQKASLSRNDATKKDVDTLLFDSINVFISNANHSANFYTAIAESEYFSEYFDVFPIYGGSLGADSIYGISITNVYRSTHSPENRISVYNNYMGQLYQLTGENSIIDIEYIDSDPFFLNLIDILRNQNLMSDLKFYDTVSSDNRYYITYEQYNMQSHYFYIYDSWELQNPYCISAPYLFWDMTEKTYGFIDGTYIIYAAAGFSREDVSLYLAEITTNGIVKIPELDETFLEKLPDKIQSIYENEKNSL